jgi:hypothetical protein
MKTEYVSPVCQLICLVSSQRVALITDFDDLYDGSSLADGKGDATIVSDGDIDIDIS